MSERSKRSRNKGSDARQAALDKIRNARQSGTVADYDIGEVDNIFEEVDEDEYEVSFNLDGLKYNIIEIEMSHRIPISIALC